MYEKVNPDHPDKAADRIAGALVDLAYRKSAKPIIAAEVLAGHGTCTVILETSEDFSKEEVQAIVNRILKETTELRLTVVRQDVHLAENQSDKLRCGDNGIFRGTPRTSEEKKLREIAEDLYNTYHSDGKYIIDEKSGTLIICQSNADSEEIRKKYPGAIVNPLGEWTGGYHVDSGATNRKLGSDMGNAVTGGGLHGKDLSKADVSVNIYAFLKAEKTGKPAEYFCAIGDETVDGKPYEEIVRIAGEFIAEKGGFEKFAEWGMI